MINITTNFSELRKKASKSPWISKKTLAKILERESLIGQVIINPNARTPGYVPDLHAFVYNTNNPSWTDRVHEVAHGYAHSKGIRGKDRLADELIANTSAMLQLRLPKEKKTFLESSRAPLSTYLTGMLIPKAGEFLSKRDHTTLYNMIKDENYGGPLHLKADRILRNIFKRRSPSEYKKFHRYLVDFGKNPTLLNRVGQENLIEKLAFNLGTYERLLPIHRRAI